MILADKNLLLKKQIRKIALKKLSLILLFQVLTLIGCKQETLLTGPVMGTSWSVRLIDANKDSLQNEIQNELDRIENIFSTWQKDSEINQINRNVSLASIEISHDFYVVMNVALQIAEASDGAFDPTLGDLIEASGFGVNEKPDTSPETIIRLKKHTGWQKVKTYTKDGKYYLQKADPLLKLNLNAVDQGYGSDSLYLLLKKKNIHQFLIDVGGEIRTSGLNKKEELWKVGIEKPENDKKEIYKVIKLSDMAVATSGGYREFKKIGNETNIHILNPATGKSVKNNLLSVTIINPNCTYADGLATAVMVLGKEKGLKFLEKFQYTDAFLLYLEDGKIKEQTTSGMKNYLE